VKSLVIRFWKPVPAYWKLLSDSTDLLGNPGGPERELMHHFLSNACFTLSLGQDPEKCNLWPVALPALAKDCLFVRHSILAISAIHLCHLGSPNSQKYSMLACHYSIQASSHFRASVHEISPNNLGRVIAFTASSAIIGLCMPLIMEQGSLGNKGASPFNPYDMLSIMRSTGQLIPMANRSTTLKEALTSLPLPLEPFDSPDFALVKNQILSSLKFLKRRLADMCESDLNEHATAHPEIGAIDALERWINSIFGGPFVWKQFVTWPQMVPEAFMACLKACCPTALEILSHWCIIMKQAPLRWYLHPWLDRTLKFASDDIELHRRSSQQSMRGSSNAPSGALARLEMQVSSGRSFESRTTCTFP
jgi:hypothetical protein